MKRYGSDYEDIMSVLYSSGIWSSFIFESIPFYMNLAFNRLFRVTLSLLFVYSRTRSDGPSSSIQEE